MSKAYRSYKDAKASRGRDVEDMRDKDRQQATYQKRSTPKSSTDRQAMRTGGWANPSRSGELRFIDNVNNTGPTIGVSTFTTGLLLNGCAQGSDASSRQGRKIVLKSILCRYSFAMTSTSTFGSQFRILIVYDKQANAAAPAITDILLTDNYSSQNNLSNRDRFVTVFDHITDSISNSGNFTCSGKLYKALNLETMFNAGSAGTIGDITTGSLYMFVAQQGLIGVANPTQMTRIRVRFEDI